MILCYVCAASATHDPCCSSHGIPLCCGCYCYKHFVEVNLCTAQDHEQEVPQ